MEKVTYIIPVYDFDNTEKYLNKALESLKNLKGTEKNEIFFVGDIDTVTKCSVLANETLKVKQTVTMVPTDETDIFTKINIAVSKCHTPYFSVLEIDDFFYPYWNEVAQKYITEKEYTILLPIEELIHESKNITTLVNEISWDAAFADNIGEINFDELIAFKDFNVTGAYIRTQDFLELGGLKPELKLVAWYDFLLHAASEKKNIFVVPRIGYGHTILRENSYMSKIQEEITTEEVLDLIQKVINTYKTEDSNKTEE